MQCPMTSIFTTNYLGRFLLDRTGGGGGGETRAVKQTPPSSTPTHHRHIRHTREIMEQPHLMDEAPSTPARAQKKRLSLSHSLKTMKSERGLGQSTKKLFGYRGRCGPCGAEPLEEGDRLGGLEKRHFGRAEAILRTLQASSFIR